MKITVNSVASVKSATAMAPGVLAKAAVKVVGKTVELTLDGTQKVSDLNSAALTAFAFDPSITIAKVVCENPAPVSDSLTLAAAGIRDGSKVNCRFTVMI